MWVATPAVRRCVPRRARRRRRARAGSRRRARAPRRSPRRSSRAADGDEPDAFFRVVAEIGAQLLAIGRPFGAEDVAAEVVVALGPGTDGGQVGPEAVGDDVFGVADEDRSVADLGMVADVLDH